VRKLVHSFNDFQTPPTDPIASPDLVLIFKPDPSSFRHDLCQSLVLFFVPESPDEFTTNEALPWG
jgi:hypothetical protein